MARKTNKAQVLELAAQLGVEVEYGRMGSEGFEVALYGYAAHMAFDPMGEGHTAITNQAGTGARTEARIWGMALADLKEFVPCADNCHCRATADADLVMTDAEPVGEPVAPVETVTTRHYVITDDDTDAEHTGSVIGNCEPFEAMRTMIGIVHNVSRETVRIWETDNYREYQFDAPHGRRGTARFLSVVETPLNPYK